MAIKPRMANRPVTDNDGYCDGEFVDITETTYIEPKTGNESDQLQFDIQVPGLVKPINIRFWTGVTVSSEKQDYSKSKDGDFSKLTRLALALNLLTEMDLDNPKKINELGDKLEGIKGTKVKFKLEKPKGKGLSRIDLDTIKLVK